MPDNFADFPFGEAHKESPAAVKAATEALTANKKIILQQFDRLTCPTSTDPAIARAEAHTLLLDSIFGAHNYLNSCPPETHENHSDYITYGQGATIKDRLGQHVTVVTQILKDILVKWQCPVVVSNYGNHDYIGLIKAFELEIKFNPTIAISSYTALLNTSNNIFASVTDEKSDDNYTRVNDFLKRIKFAQKLFVLSYMRPNPAGEFLFKDKEIDWSSFSQNLKKARICDRRRFVKRNSNLRQRTRRRRANARTVVIQSDQRAERGRKHNRQPFRTQAKHILCKTCNQET